MSLGGIGFGVAAGALSTLSPCVLPLLPLVLTGAAAAHRWGMVALVGGLVLSFVCIGLFVATIGFSLGLTGDVFRTISAVLLAGLGIVLLSEPLQARFALSMAGIGNSGNTLAARLRVSGLTGQFLVGLLLGAIWSACVGPTLGAASLLAAQGRDLASVAAVMIAFAIGTALPLLAVGALGRGGLRLWQRRAVNAGKAGKRILGAAVLVVGVLILTGTDHAIEAGLVASSPPWLTRLTTQF